MKKKYNAGLLFLLSCLVLSVSNATVRLPALISSNMVLQRNTTISLWGWADPGEKITIKTSWRVLPIQVTAGNSGNWKVEVATTNSRATQFIRISSGKQLISLDNILFGEVWICSGQSNMEMPLSGNPGQPVFGSQEAIAHANDAEIRLFSVAKQATTEPSAELNGYKSWQPVNPETAKDFSAIAYFFGKQLHDILKVPIGLIHSSWGGSLIEAWMSKESLAPIKNFDLKEVDLKRGNRFPTVLFNAMINPLIPFTIKGALWYQGEANISQPDQYRLLFPAMVKDWRERWGIGDFPFYYVQIAPFRYSNQNRMDDANNAAFLREVQAQCLDIIPHSGMAVTLDIGTENVIHPPVKKEVADRLLYNALHTTYGYRAVNFSGPAPDSVKLKDKAIHITFRNAEKGLYASGKLEGFEIAGADRIFYPAEASIFSGSQVIIKSDKVMEPVAVRYGFRSWTKGTLFNTFLLPASSFRTDNWKDAKQAD
jgi:sialate O-acetylesterase